MRDTAIYKALSKQIDGLIGDDCSQPSRSDYMLTEVFKYKEDEWVCPTNMEGNHYSIFNELYGYGFVGLKRIPIWKSGSYIGVKISFMYRKDLNYRNE